MRARPGKEGGKGRRRPSHWELFDRGQRSRVLKAAEAWEARVSGSGEGAAVRALVTKRARQDAGMESGGWGSPRGGGSGGEVEEREMRILIEEFRRLRARCVRALGRGVMTRPFAGVSGAPDASPPLQVRFAESGAHGPALGGRRDQGCVSRGRERAPRAKTRAALSPP